jgi:pSer/pThr/pTyr-binding forkhead associated (FHA) protein
MDSGYKLRSEADGSETPLRHGMVVGRGEDCDLVIRHGVVSRRHARINLVEGVPWVEDLGSTNGTRVNGEPVRSATRLKPSDIVSFDDIAYQVLGAASAAAASAPDRDRTIVGARPSPNVAADAAAETTIESAKTPPPKSARPRVETPPPPLRTELPAVGREIESSPGIPASWAESEGLEAASHTQALPVLLRQISQRSGDTEGLIEAARKHSRVRQPRLIGLNGIVAGQVFGLDRGREDRKWEIGRDGEADIRLLDESVSGRHAQLLYEGGRWKLVNLMSVNGSFVNGRKVLSAYLKTTDKVRFGNVELAFDAGEDAAPRSRGGASGEQRPGLLARLRAALRRLFGRG